MIWAEFAVVLLAILVGARIGGVGMGTVAVIGLAVLVFGFGLPPSSPPGQVLAIILAVVTAAATMQAAGGMDLMVTVAEKALRAKPRWITFVAPAVAYIFTFASGTGHVAYAILPVIAEVSRKAGIRPERPISISVIASQQAITASPLAAATAGLLALLEAKGLMIGGHKVELWHILAICIPSTFLGCMIGALAVCRAGKELKDDPIYQARLAAGQVEAPKPQARLEGAARRNAIGSVAAFLSAAVLIVCFGMFPSMRPSYPAASKSNAVTFEVLRSELAVPVYDDPADQPVTLSQIEQAYRELQTGDKGSPKVVSVSMAVVIQIVMYAGAGIMMLFFGAKPAAAIKTPVATAGVVAVISVLGLGWMGNCFFDGNQPAVVAALSDIIKAPLLGVCCGPFRAQRAAVQSGVDGGRADAAGHRPGYPRAESHCVLPGSERVLLPPDVRDDCRRGVVRPDGNDANRQVRSESQLHGSRIGFNSIRNWHRTVDFTADLLNTPQLLGSPWLFSGLFPCLLKPGR